MAEANNEWVCLEKVQKREFVAFKLLEEGHRVVYLCRECETQQQFGTDIVNEGIDFVRAHLTSCQESFINHITEPKTKSTLKR